MMKNEILKVETSSRTPTIKPTPSEEEPASHSRERANAARRRNAQKSTGPRTRAGKRRVAVNACQHGLYASAVHRSLLALGDSPDDFRDQLQAFINDFGPAGRTEHMLIEHIALLELERQRVLRSMWGLQQRAREEFQLERRRNAREVGSTSYAGGTDKEMLERGLANLPDSADKLGQQEEYWDVIRERVEQGDFSQDLEPVLRALYGSKPSSRGASVESLYHDLAKRHKAGRPIKIKDKSDPDYHKYQLLQQLVLEEARNVMENWQDYFEQNIEVRPAMLDALLVPESSKYALILRHMSAIDRQMERKIRLLFDVQDRRRAYESVGFHPASGGSVGVQPATRRKSRGSDGFQPAPSGSAGFQPASGNHAGGSASIQPTQNREPDRHTELTPSSLSSRAPGQSAPIATPSSLQPNDADTIKNEGTKLPSPVISAGVQFPNVEERRGVSLPHGVRSRIEVHGHDGQVHEEVQPDWQPGVLFIGGIAIPPEYLEPWATPMPNGTPMKCASIKNEGTKLPSSLISAAMQLPNAGASHGVA
jgi:hypothetical protein